MLPVVNNVRSLRKSNKLCIQIKDLYNLVSWQLQEIDALYDLKNRLKILSFWDLETKRVHTIQLYISKKNPLTKKLFTKHNKCYAFR